MCIVNRLIAVLLVATLAGGAQACVTMCAKPAQVALAAPERAPEKSACGRCGVKAPQDQSKPRPTAPPCKHCAGAAQDRVSGERDLVVKPAAMALTLVPVLVNVGTAVHLGARFLGVSAAAQGPPRDLLGQFCLFLI